MFTTHIDFFDPIKIADSGQAFRIHPIDDTHTELVAFGRYLQIASLGTNEYAFSCTEKEFKDIWFDYFDLDTDYEAVVKSIHEDDEFLTQAALFGHGIRILKQEVFETVISYIISQRRSIPSITTCVDRLSELAGTKIKIPKIEEPFVKPLKKSYYAFPEISQLSKLSADQLNGIGAGYRTAYIISAAEDFSTGKLDAESLKKLNDDELYEALINMYGVGKKVANCIMLFAFHRVGRFPVDVWIKRIEDTYYNGHFETEEYPGISGILQQFMFYFIRKNQKGA